VGLSAYTKIFSGHAPVHVNRQVGPVQRSWRWSPPRDGATDCQFVILFYGGQCQFYVVKKCWLYFLIHGRLLTVIFRSRGRFHAFFFVLHSLHISHSTWATMSYHLLFDSVAVTFLSITSLGFSKLSISHRSGYFVFLNLLTSHCVVRCPTYIRYSTPCSLCWLRCLLPV
jgi:hypothetical protein